MRGGNPVDAGAQAVQIMDKSLSKPAPKIPFHCGWEWHMRNQAKPCALVYGLASRLTARTKGEPANVKRNHFFASVKTISAYLGCHPETVRRGIEALREIGFFEWKGVRANGVNCSILWLISSNSSLMPDCKGERAELAQGPCIFA
jgi:hypothetical protein